MSAPFIPAAEYGDDVIIWTLPMLPWRLRSAGVGGSAVAASGTQEAYTIRIDRLMDVTLRVLEEEVEDTLLFLETVRGAAEPFDFSFDGGMTSIEVELVAPTWADGPIEPERDSSYLGLFTVALTLRTADGSAWGVDWSAEEEA
jgi:hypothetical protein